MPPLKQNPQILNLPFNHKLSVLDRRRLKIFFIFFALLTFLSLMFAASNVMAQTHPGMSGFQLPPEAKGDFYLSQGKFKEALGIYKSTLKDKSNDSYIFRNMVKAWEALKALDEAEKFLNDYRTSHENSSAVWYALGYVHYLKNEDQPAEELFKRATELDPGNGLAWNNWAATLSNGKRFQEAIEKVRIAMRTNPKELMFFFNLKKIYKELGEGQKFEEEFDEALRNDADPFVWGYGKVLARSLRQNSFREYAKGNLTGAISGFEKILDINRRIGDMKGQVPALFSLGLLHEESGDLQKGQEFFRQVLAINPNHIQAREKMEPKN
jgi:tetratricopeptide (TPR) repeat protein